MKEDILKSIRQKYVLRDFIGNHPIFTNLVQKLKKIATKNVSVLLIGETGSGKGRCAEFIHHYSDRFNCPFIPYNSGAGPDSLFESQLFGHVKGAFTSANSIRIGLVEEADTGILFLDEINSLSHESQVKLNYFLETGCFRRVGDNRLLTSNVRVISASNVNLYQEVCDGRFREDLYYRLAEYELFVPPLRFRKEDIPLLAEYFLEKYSYLNTIGKFCLNTHAQQTLMKYDWPGNIRELENFIKRIIIDAKSNIINSVELPSSHYPSAESYNAWMNHLPLKEAKRKSISLFEKNYLQTLLKQHHGIVAQCARHAGIHPSDFWKMMRKYKLKAKDFRNIDR
jgi:DNA-binding NtrC family response regulator